MAGVGFDEVDVRNPCLSLSLPRGLEHHTRHIDPQDAAPRRHLFRQRKGGRPVRTTYVDDILAVLSIGASKKAFTQRGQHLVDAIPIAQPLLGRRPIPKLGLFGVESSLFYAHATPKLDVADARSKPRYRDPKLQILQ